MHGLLRGALVLSLCALPSLAIAANSAPDLDFPPPPPPDDGPPDPPDEPVAGPPLPTSASTGTLSTDKIQDAMYEMYTECLDDTNGAFEGEHDHGAIVDCDHCDLEEVDDWECANPGWWNYWNHDACGWLWMTAIDGADNDQNHVVSTNWMHYKVNFGYLFNRHFYIKVPLRIYCEGWDQPAGGTIRVVQGESQTYLGSAGTWESIIGGLASAVTFSMFDLEDVIEGVLNEQLNDIDEMGHEIPVDGLSGQACTSLGMSSYLTPYENAEIRWDVPVSLPLMIEMIPIVMDPDPEPVPSPPLPGGCSVSTQTPKFGFFALFMLGLITFRRRFKGLLS